MTHHTHLDTPLSVGGLFLCGALIGALTCDVWSFEVAQVLIALGCAPLALVQAWHEHTTHTIQGE